MRLQFVLVEMHMKLRDDLRESRHHETVERLCLILSIHLSRGFRRSAIEQRVEAANRALSRALLWRRPRQRQGPLARPSRRTSRASARLQLNADVRWLSDSHKEQMEATLLRNGPTCHEYKNYCYSIEVMGSASLRVIIYCKKIQNELNDGDLISNRRYGLWSIVKGLPSTNIV